MINTHDGQRKAVADTGPKRLKESWLKVWLTFRFLHSRFWRWMASGVVAHLTFRLFGYPKFPVSSYFDYQKALQKDPVDAHFYAWVGADTRSLSWLLLYWTSRVFRTKTWFGHAGVLRREGDELIIYHMQAKGLQRDNLIDYLRKVDDFKLLRYELNGNAREAHHRLDFIIKNAHHIEYDYPYVIDDETSRWIESGGQYDPRTDKKKKFGVFCSELVYLCLRDLDAPHAPKPTELLAEYPFQDGAKYRDKRLTITPDDIYNRNIVVSRHT